MKNNLLKYLQLIRENKSISDLQASLLKTNLIFSILFFFLIIIESTFYLAPNNRILVTTYFCLSYFITHIYILLKCYLNYTNLFSNSSNESISKIIGHKFPGIQDKLLNAYQLESNLNPENITEYELSLHAIKKIENELNDLVISFNKAKINFLLKTSLAIIPSIIIIIILSSPMLNSFNRLLKPSKAFKVPTPFYLEKNSISKNIFDGDNYQITIIGHGYEIPDSINLNYIINNKKSAIKIAKNKKIPHAIFNYTFKNIQEDIIWWGEVSSNSFFSKWDNIQTEKDTIVAIKRPIIDNLSFTIEPPPYTKLKSFVHPPNMTNIKLPYGSKVKINGSSNQQLSDLLITINNKTFSLNINNEKQFEGSQLFKEKSKISLICKDANLNIMSHPIYYNVNIIPDNAPSLSIISPENEFLLNETDEINLDIEASDDYGISNVWVEYKIKKPSYIEYQDTNTYVYELIQFNKNTKLLDLNHRWNISSLNLATQDELYFTIHISDNNSFLPSIIKSKTFIGKYPTLEDLFKEMDAYEENISQQNEEVIGDVDDVQNLINDLQLELLKSDELGWEEKNKIDEAITEMENIFNQLEEISEIMEKAQEKADENELISDELINKYDDFQNLLEELITPEIRDIMEKIKQYNEAVDLDQLLSELNDFDQHVQELEEQLNRFIDMFEQAIAEQKIDELIKKLESLLNKQMEIAKELNNADADLKELSLEQLQVEKEYTNIQDVMKEAQKSSEKISKTTSEMLSELINSTLNKKTTQSIQSSQKSLQKKEKESSKENTKIAEQNIAQMKKEVQEIQDNFQEQTVDEMMNDFFSVVNSILNISEYQDELSLLSNGIRSNSPLLPKIAKKQYRIKSQNEQLMKQILELSRKTFYITPPIIRALGQASLAMDNSISYLEQKQSTQALKEQSNIIDGLNETAYLLINSMKNMMESGSASGLENFLEQLGDLANQQQGLNQETMQMPQLGMSGQKSMMQQLMEQQQTLKEGLEQLLNNMPGNENTGLGQASQDMEEVINDFKRNQVDRETIERQQKILTRMLDSQKSLTQKDFSKKRKNEKPDQNIIYNNELEMPLGQGEKEIILMNALEEALKEGHSNEYQEIIKLYFYNLQKSENE